MFCVFRKSDGLPQGGTMHLPCHADVDHEPHDGPKHIGTQVIVELNRESFPDPKMERWDAALEAVRPATTAELASQNREQYATLRREAYPPVADYLDAIVKGDEVQLQRYLNACLAVKAKYPKPEVPA